MLLPAVRSKYSSYTTGHNSFTSQYLLNIYIYCRFCRLCIINCEIKKNYLNRCSHWGWETQVSQSYKTTNTILVLYTVFLLHLESAWSNLRLGKHVTYRCIMERSYSFIKLVDMHLVLGECIGNATDAVRRYRKNTPLRECQIALLSLPLTADSERREHCTQGAGKSSSWMTSVPEVLQLPCFCTPYSTRTAVALSPWDCKK
jgi:hypothetical protein